MNIKHVAIIPDGNRRWAKKNLLNSFEGHKKGVIALEDIFEKALDLKIPFFTFWGASYDNLTKRSKLEINNLIEIFNIEFEKLLTDKRIEENKVKVDVLGKWKEVLPQKTQDLIEKCIEKTKDNDDFRLTFLIAYNGTDEMIECISKIKASNQEVTKENIKANLWTKDLPSVDLIIRTGEENDPHLSAGFMMWDSAYTQLHFTKTLFPDFKKEEFEKIILGVEDKERRLGK